ncbi:hypothetical protein [Psychrobacter sp. AOP22-C2-15]|uniref:hypothetical protein n=1 Tax=Psychrobacter sp. AOP22-C2-15 TaxID=3457715 RepID=UPI004036A8BB
MGYYNLLEAVQFYYATTISAKQFTEKGGKHSKTGGGVDGLGLAGLPSLIAGAMFKAQFKFADDDDIPYANTPYIAINENTKERFEGVTDIEGNTETFFSSNPDEIKVHLKNKDPWGSIELYKVQFKFTDDDGIPYSNVHYRAISEVKELVYLGITNSEGETEELVSSIEEDFNVHLYLSTNGDY